MKGDDIMLATIMTGLATIITATASVALGIIALFIVACICIGAILVI